MKLFASGLASLTSTLGLLTLNFAVSLPAQAAIVCESGTISNYQNGSLATCILRQDTSLQVSSPHSGTFNLICKAKNYISFDDKAQFTSCQLAVDIEIKKGNSLEKCPAEYRVNVSVTNDGNLLISCPRY
jgi:hypothetical protein